MVQGIPTNGGAHAQMALLLEHDSVRREVKFQTGRVMQYATDSRILPINLDLSDNPCYSRDSAQLNSIWGMPIGQPRQRMLPRSLRSKEPSG
jgi:hypothetical protein